MRGIACRRLCVASFNPRLVISHEAISLRRYVARSYGGFNPRLVISHEAMDALRYDASDLPVSIRAS